MEVRRTAFMRYRGQGHEIEVAADGDLADHDFADRLLDGFIEQYRRLYGQAIAGNAAEITSWAIRVQRVREVTPIALAEPPASPAASTGTRRVFDGAREVWASWPTFERTALVPGAQGEGPAIIAEAETTTVIPPGFAFWIDARHAIRLTRRRG